MEVVSSADIARSRVCHRQTGDLLRVHNLTVRYGIDGQELNAVNDVSFGMAPGEIVGLLGESGCGKTTTALSLPRMLPDTARVSAKSIVFCGRDLLSLGEPQLRKVRGAQIAVVYQDSSILNPVIRVGSQVSEVLRAHFACPQAEAREKVLSIFAAIGLAASTRIYEAYPHQLSGGQRQRIAIAQALVCSPQLVIADEPTSSVDPNTASEILACIRRMRESHNTSFLLISHDPKVIAAVADRVLVMYAGQIVEDGLLADVYTRPLHPYTEALLKCGLGRVAPEESAARKHLPFIPGNSPDPVQVFRGCSFASRCVERMQVCDARRPELFNVSGNGSARCFKCEVT